MIDISKNQLEDILTEYLSKENGLNEVLQMTLNSLMRVERDMFLEGNKEPEIKNKANGYRPVQALGYGKTLRLSVPRDRLGLFKPYILGIYQQEEQQIHELCFNLYSKGLTTGEVGDIIGQIYGHSYSSASISHITQSFKEEMERWRKRPLERYYPVLYIDALHVKVRREQVSSEAFYVILAVKEDLTREILAIENIPTESSGGWEDVLASLKERGLKKAGLIVCDDLKGLDGALHRTFPEAKIQKCVVHLMRQLSKYVKPKHRNDFQKELKEIFQTQDSSYSFQQAWQKIENFCQKWQSTYPKLTKKLIEGDQMQYYFTYLNYDYRIRSMIYTTNWIERLNKTFKRTLKIRNSLPNEEAVLTLLSKVAMDQNEGKYSYPIYQFKYEQSLLNTIEEP